MQAPFFVEIPEAWPQNYRCGIEFHFCKVRLAATMITRQATDLCLQLASEFKALAVVGPRQAGKTTLAQAVFSNKPYASLEEPDVLRFAAEDPRRFLAQYPNGAVLDEVQRCPDLFSYLQGIIDASRETGQFILTGSQHFALTERLTQSLAGRVGFLRLLPFSYEELEQCDDKPESLDEALFLGGYPPLYDQPVDPERWLNAYIATYVERDVRQLTNIRDLATFQRFMRLCAGSVGQLLNMSRIASDTGVDQKTAKAWLAILEASFIVRLLRPHHRNFRKRLVKAPKLYFFDTGLVARLLGIESPRQVVTHPLRGALFENWVISELLKGLSNRGKQENLFFWRSHVGHEVDLLLDRGTRLWPIEIKAGSTIASDWFDGLRRWMALAREVGDSPALVYGGDRSQVRGEVQVIPWRKIDGLAESALHSG
jgi:predicted AAA+ superfamily ATPase